jgi:hypothetical protein
MKPQLFQNRCVPVITRSLRRGATCLLPTTSTRTLVKLNFGGESDEIAGPQVSRNGTLTTRNPNVLIGRNGQRRNTQVIISYCVCPTARIDSNRGRICADHPDTSRHEECTRHAGEKPEGRKENAYLPTGQWVSPEFMNNCRGFF